MQKPRLNLVIMSMLCMMSLPVLAGINDGRFLSSSALIENGPAADKMNIVFMGDGYTEDEQEVFNAKVEKAFNDLFSSHPFYTMRCAMNVIRINIASNDSGVDIPATCGPDNLSGAQMRATAMDATYCSDARTERCVFGDIMAVAQWASMAGIVQGAPNVFIYVFVNQNRYGGCAQILNRVAFGWTGDGYEKTVIHELGHALSGLADEYDVASPGTFPDPEPPEINATIATTLRTIKWNDLILSTTSIPTISKKCDTDDDQGSDNYDLVGLYEGAVYHTCGVFRPSVTCKMRDSDNAFCSVCRREVIRDLQPFMCKPMALSFTEVTIFDDSDPWPKGEGEINFDYLLTSSVDHTNGKWPGGDGTSDFDDDETQSLDHFFAGTLADPATAQLRTEFNESDWPDGDDDLDDDETNALPASGDFTITSDDYELKGNLVNAPLHLLLDMLHISDDEDWPDDGDIYINYSVDNGSTVVKGRYPTGDGEMGMGDDETVNLGYFGAAVPLPGDGGEVTIKFDVWDGDPWIRGGDDHLGSGNFTFTTADGFGSNNTTFCKAESGFRITFSLFKVD